jgi:hypothetical protein
MTLEQKIRMAMAYAGIHQQVILAKALDISPQNFSKKLKRSSFTDEELGKMAAAMGARYYAGFIFGDALYPVEIPPMEGLRPGEDIAEKALRIRTEIELLAEQDEEAAKKNYDPDLEERLARWYESDEYKAKSAAEKAAWEARVQERMKKLKK